MHKILCGAIVVAGLGLSQCSAAEEQERTEEQAQREEVLALLGGYPEVTEAEMTETWSAIQALKEAGDLSEYDTQAIEMSKSGLDSFNELLRLEWQEQKETFEEFARAHPGFFQEGEDTLKEMDFQSISVEDARNIMKNMKLTIDYSKRVLEVAVCAIRQRIADNKEFVKKYAQ